MLRNTFFAFLVCVAITSSSSAEVNWRDDYKQVLSESKTTGKPILIFFTRTVCPPCKMLEAQFLNKPQFQKDFGDKFHFVKINLTPDSSVSNELIDQHRSIQSKLGVRATPILVAIDANENLLFSPYIQLGYEPKPQVNQAITRNLLAVMNKTQTSPQIETKESGPIDNLDGWETDYDFALSKAKQSGKPILVYFNESGCTTCERFKSRLLNSPEFKRDYGHKFHLVALNIGSDVQKRLGVTSPHTLVAIDAKEKLLISPHIQQGYNADQNTDRTIAIRLRAALDRHKERNASDQ